MAPLGDAPRRLVRCPPRRDPLPRLAFLPFGALGSDRESRGVREQNSGSAAAAGNRADAAWRGPCHPGWDWSYRGVFTLLRRASL